MLCASIARNCIKKEMFKKKKKLSVDEFMPKVLFVPTGAFSLVII